MKPSYASMAAFAGVMSAWSVCVANAAGISIVGQQLAIRFALLFAGYGVVTLVIGAKRGER